MQRAWGLAVLVFLLTGQAGVDFRQPDLATTASAIPAAIAVQDAPKIASVLWTGRDLVVIGENFDDGAVVLLNGKKQRTINDPEHPATMLTAKKAGKRLAPGAALAVEVKNPDGTQSEEYRTQALRTVTLAEDGETISLRVGDHVFIYLGSDLDWSLQPFDTTILRAVAGVGTLIIGAQALLEAEQLGRTTLSLKGDAPCRRLQPPCMVPSRQFRVTIVVQ